MPRRPVEVLPFDRDLRSARRGAIVGAILGLVLFAVLLLPGGGSARQVLGALLICVAAGATFGALVPISSASRYANARPSSKGRLLLLLLAIGVVGLGAVVLGGFVGGFLGR